jgi:hypothetical protein
VSHEELLSEVCGLEYIQDTANLSVYVRYLRGRASRGTALYLHRMGGYRFDAQAMGLPRDYLGPCSQDTLKKLCLRVNL